MKILNFGSLNLDYVYQVPHFLAPGETMAASAVEITPGGKGLNQSVALARAGVNVCHAGMVGSGGEMLVDVLRKDHVDVIWLKQSQHLQGNAVIQVTPSGENAILLYGGSNREITSQQVRETISCFQSGDWLVLQNEVSCLAEMVQQAGKHGMRIVLNPSPFEEKLYELDFSLIEWLFINEVEGYQMTGEVDPQRILTVLRKRYPSIKIVLTLGEMGAICDTPIKRIAQQAFSVQAVDTTAAGDTFTGYFIASCTQGYSLEECMKRAACASAISVSRSGASSSIPFAAEVEAMLAEMSTL